MIIKSFQIINNIEITKRGKIFFLYGINFGLKKEIKNLIISEHKKLNSNIEIISHDEDEILKEKDHFFNLLYIKSLFDEKRVLVINKISDKFLNYLENILEKEIKDVVIILLSEILDKKSKIRSMCEKEKQVYLIPCYEDSLVDLELIAKKELKFKNINYSNEIINLLINKSNGDRNNLYNEIEKISSFVGKENKISFEEIRTLTTSNDDIKSENLINSCLCGNTLELKKLLPELYINTFNYILFIKIFSRKIERLIKLKNAEHNFDNYDLLFKSFKPPIFWKEKPMLKKQLKIWKINQLEKIITKLNRIEFECKIKSEISSIIFLNFFVGVCKQANNFS